METIQNKKRKRHKNGNMPFQFDLHKDLREDIRKDAELRGMTSSQWLRMAIRKELGKPH